MLTGIAFSQVLPEAENFAYVGGPNATVEMGQRDGFVYGEMWIPVVKNKLGQRRNENECEHCS